MTASLESESRLDPAGVRSAFERASAAYEAAAVLQARVGGELLERLALFKFEPQLVLDLGAGTGRLTGELKRAYKRATVVALDIAPGMLREARRHLGLFRRFERVCGDVRRLPFADASVDLAVSNLMLQWCDDLDVALAEIRRVLKPDGFFSFSTFGPDTLRELRSAWAAVDDYTHVNTFLDMHDVGDALARAGLSEPVLDVERVTLTYPNVLALMRDLKVIGAHNVTAGRARGLTGRSRLRRMEEAYEAYRRDGRIPATYEVVYGAAWGSAGRGAVAALDGEVRIPPSAIRRRVRE
ncbi:MAG TPA: malonyl-ACP O-methyltransferase BioC [Steroidobacteraceae bacterium]|jgi:malonyl-CoA O-methyltransferase|nr:malonyl-ACP O-methyltransferase BioC [Steroidobacteraceae bacterium]